MNEETPPPRADEGALALRGASDADRRLLIVDDDAPLCQRLARAMETRGFLVDTAESVAAGIAAAHNRPPAYAVVDLRLGDGNGLDVVAALRQSRPGVRIVMLTGDDRRTAAAVGRRLGIDDIVAGVLPEGKAAAIAQLQREGRVVAMAGDGINDAPALAAADVGIAMGTGTDIAIESAGITLVKGDLLGIVGGVAAIANAVSHATGKRVPDLPITLDKSQR